MCHAENIYFLYCVRNIYIYCVVIIIISNTQANPHRENKTVVEMSTKYFHLRPSLVDLCEIVVLTYTVYNGRELM